MAKRLSDKDKKAALSNQDFFPADWSTFPNDQAIIDHLNNWCDRLGIRRKVKRKSNPVAKRSITWPNLIKFSADYHQKTRQEQARVFLHECHHCITVRRIGVVRFYGAYGFDKLLRPAHRLVIETPPYREGAILMHFQGRSNLTIADYAETRGAVVANMLEQSLRKEAREFVTWAIMNAVGLG